MAIDFMNMFAPRGAPSGLDALFNEDQRRLMGRNANLSAAAALLQASGLSRQRVGLGQALGAALQAGQQGYQQARAGSLQDLLLGEKLREGQAARARQTNIEGIINTGIRPAVAGMPAQMVEEEGRFLGETPAVAARPAGFDFQAIAPQLMAQGPEGRKAFGELLAAQKTLMGDTFSLAEGAKQYQRDPITGVVTEIAAGAPKREAVPGEIQAYQLAQDQGFTGSFVDFKNALRPPTAPPSAVAEYQFAVGQGYKGTFEQFDQARRKSSATTVSVGAGKDLTPGQKKVDEKFADNYVEWQTGGGADMVGNLAAIGTVLGKLESGQQLTGPMVGIQPDFVRAIVNPNATDALERVQEVVQRNLRIVLGGAFTEKEGAQLINRAYNPSLPPATNAARLRKLFQQLSVSAQQRQGMVDFFEENGTLQGYRGPRPNINDFYKALESGESGTQRKPLSQIFGGPR
jgi:hypothetical protein